MKTRHATQMAIALAMALSTSALAHAGVPTVNVTKVTYALAPTANQMHATKGRITAIDTHRLVINRSGKEMTFMLNPATERAGALKVGSTVDVRYRTEGSRQVATAVTAQPATQTTSAPATHK